MASSPVKVLWEPREVASENASGILHIVFTVAAGEIGMCPDMALKSTQSSFLPSFVHLFRPNAHFVCMRHLGGI